jgi:hypothetical protein
VEADHALVEAIVGVAAGSHVGRKVAGEDWIEKDRCGAVEAMVKRRRSREFLS